MTIARNATFGGAALVTGTTGTVSTTPLQSSAFSCSSSARLVIVAVGLGNTTGTVNQPLAVSWVGDTPANATAFEKVLDGQNSGNNHTGEFWVARVTGALSGVQVQVAPAASSASSAETLAVDVLDGDDALIVSATVARGTNASAVAAGVTLPNVRAGAWLYGVGSGEGAATWSPVANFTELDDRRDAGTANAAFGLNATGTAGDVLVGWSNTVDYGGWAGIEVREQPAIGAQDGFSGGWDTDRMLHLDDEGTPSDALWPDTAPATVLWETMFPAATGPATYNEAWSEAVTAADSLATGGTFPHAWTEAITAADAIPGGTLFPNTWTDSVTAADSLASSSTLRNPYTEAVTAADTLATGGTFRNAWTETVAAAETLASSSTLRQSWTEAATAADTLSTTGTWPNAWTEAVTAAESIADSLTGGSGTTYNESWTDSATAGDSLSNSLTARQAWTEPATAGDTLASSATYRNPYTDAASAGDSLASSASYGLTWTEAVVAGWSIADALSGPVDLGWIQTMRPVRGEAQAVAAGSAPGASSGTAPSTYSGTSSTTAAASASEMEEGSC